MKLRAGIAFAPVVAIIAVLAVVLAGRGLEAASGLTNASFEDGVLDGLPAGWDSAPAPEAGGIEVVDTEGPAEFPTYVDMGNVTVSPYAGTRMLRLGGDPRMVAQSQERGTYSVSQTFTPQDTSFTFAFRLFSWEFRGTDTVSFNLASGATPVGALASPVVVTIDGTPQSCTALPCVFTVDTGDNGDYTDSGWIAVTVINVPGGGPLTLTYAVTPDGSNSHATWAYFDSPEIPDTATPTSTPTDTPTPTETPIPNATPVAAFVFDPDPATEGETIQFSDLSFDPDPTDTIVDWSWEIDDVVPQVLDSQNPLYLFADNGTYPVTLTVESSDGTTASTTVNVAVANIAPLVNALNAEALAGEDAPVIVRFADPGWDDLFTADVTLDGAPVAGILQADNNPAYASGIFEGTGSSEGLSEGNAAITDDDGGTGIDGYSIEVVPADADRHEPNDTLAGAPILASDWSHLSFIQSPGDVDLYEVIVQPGGELLVTLRDLPADYDLVLLSLVEDGVVDPGDSGEASFSTTPFTRSPFTRSPFTRSPFTRSPFTRSPFTRSPFTRSDFGFTELPLSQLAFTGLEGDEIIGTDIGLGELGLSLIEAENVRIAGFSAKRGLETETALGRTTTAGERMFIAVVGHNDQFETAAPYRLQVEVSQPLDLEALLGSAACTGTPLVPSPAAGATLFSGPTAGPRTLFVTQAERMIAVHGQEAFDAMMLDLQALAGHAAVGGDIISLPSGIYDAWDQQPCSIEAANAVTDAIAAELNVAGGTYDYIVFAGDDGIVPFRREPDETAISNERDYAIDSFLRQGSPLFASLALGYNLTDDFYADVDPIAWQGRSLYVPDVPIGRLVETPAEIGAQAQAFIASNGQLNAATGFVSGYDFFTDGSQATAGSLAQGLQTTTLINDTWTADDLRCGFLGIPFGPCAPKDISAPNAHMTHYAGLSADGFTTFDLDDFLASSEVAGSPLVQGALAFSMGCHAGFNAPDRDSIDADPGLGIDPAMDFAQAMAVQRAIWVASTGFGLGDTVGLGGTEQLMAIFAEDLTAGSATAGGALVSAKQSYINGLTAKTVYDEKSTIQTTLYGLPMYQLNVPQSGGTLTAAAVPSGLTLTVYDGDPTTVTPTTTVGPYAEVLTDDGTYITAGGDASSTAARAVQPKVVLEDVTPPLGVPVHGALLFGGSYEDILGFDPVIAHPTSEWVVDALEPQVCLESFWPAELATVNSLMTLGGLLQSVVVTPAQFRCDDTPPVTGRERLYTSLTFELLRCESTDFVPPAVHSIELLAVDDGDEDGDQTVHATIDATDASGIVRIVGLVFANGTITPTFLGVEGSGPFEMDVLDVPADALMVFLVQDGACNVTWATGKGAKLKVMLIDAGADKVYEPDVSLSYTTTVFDIGALTLPLYYEWDFGDGTVESATLMSGDLTPDGFGNATFTVNHAYTGVIAGTADVTVLDAAGGIATDAAGFACDDSIDVDGDLLSICDELDLGTNPDDVDTDGDGCADGEEVLFDKMLGGERDPLNQWDFYDVTGNKIIDAQDIGLVRAHFDPDGGTDPGDEIYDRSVGTAPWAPGPPNGVINAFDIALARASFMHTCAGPP